MPPNEDQRHDRVGRRAHTLHRRSHARAYAPVDFRATTEALVAEVVAAGHFGFNCDHQGGHAPNLGLDAAEFMAVATWGEHPWVDYPFGTGGASWVLDNYCYASGDPSPWGS